MSEPNLVWENHSCMPLRVGHDLMPQLDRYRRAGVDVVSLNATFDLMERESSFSVLAYMRSWIEASADYALGLTAARLDANRRAGKTSIVFDIEGLKSIGEQLDLVDTYYELGVRWASPIYNRANQFGGGCLDQENAGLTSLGHELVGAMNRVGMVVCCSHTSARASFEIIDASSAPVIFSHSNADRIYAHPRNITDAQIKACAARGGVIGINGIGIFLGQNDTSLDTFTRHVCHMTDLVGASHVGVSLDHAFDVTEVEDFFKNNRDTFPEAQFGSTLDMVQPEVFGVLGEALSARGMSPREIERALGGNWERIARSVWK